MKSSSQKNQNSIRRQDQTPQLFLANLLTLFRNVVGGDRFENLYTAIEDEVRNLKKCQSDLSNDKLSLLDYGCGAMSFSERLYNEGHLKSFVGMDTFPMPSLHDGDNEKWKHYQQIPEGGINKIFGNYDLTIVIDVFHHIPLKDQAKILQSLSAVSRYILVKDHFEYGFISRQLLRLADWYGNYAYGVSVPKRYFDKVSWQNLVKSVGLKALKIRTEVKVHEGLFGLIIPPRHHFISILTSSQY